MKERAKILLVEDEDLSRDSLIRLLKMTGFNVRGAANGKLALSFLSHEQFDIIITDLFLPDINGIDILKQVKELSPFHRGHSHYWTCICGNGGKGNERGCL